MAIDGKDLSSAELDSTKLGCGRTIDDVWDRVGQPPDEHEATCSDCQAARTNLDELAQATQAMAAADVADPTLHASPSVISRILQVARAEVRRGKIIPLFHSPPHGEPQGAASDLGISEQTIAGVVRRTCDQMLGIEARRCHVELYVPDPGHHTSHGTSHGTVSGAPAGPLDDSLAETVAGLTSGRRLVEVRVRLSLSVAPRVAIAPLAHDVRARVITALAEQVGVLARAVDVVVEDVHRGF